MEFRGLEFSIYFTKLSVTKASATKHLSRDRTISVIYHGRPESENKANSKRETFIIQIEKKCLIRKTSETSNSGPSRNRDSGSRDKIPEFS